jgi:hypothetical protein
MKRLAVDLVIVNERAASDVQGLQIALETLVRSGGGRSPTACRAVNGLRLPEGKSSVKLLDDGERHSVTATLGKLSTPGLVPLRAALHAAQPNRARI